MMRYRCPKCKSETIDVQVNTWAKLAQDPVTGELQTLEGEAFDSSHEWDADSVIHCRQCSHAAPSREFAAPEPEPPLMDALTDEPLLTIIAALKWLVECRTKLRLRGFDMSHLELGAEPLSDEEIEQGLIPTLRNLAANVTSTRQMLAILLRQLDDMRDPTSDEINEDTEAMWFSGNIDLEDINVARSMAGLSQFEVQHDGPERVAHFVEKKS